MERLEQKIYPTKGGSRETWLFLRESHDPLEPVSRAYGNSLFDSQNKD